MTATPPAGTTTPPAATQPPQQADATAQAAPAAAPAQDAVRLATAADVHTGVQVRDQQGAVVATVESADATGAVLSTGSARARVPLTSLGANSQGLVIAMTRDQLNAAIAHVPPQPSGG